MIPTARQKFVIRAALSYALSNNDDLNDAFAVEPDDGGTDAISVGGIDGPPLGESEVQAIIDLFEPTTRPAPTGLRAFKGNFLVAIDPSEANEGDAEPPLTLDGLTNFSRMRWSSTWTRRGAATRSGSRAPNSSSTRSKNFPPTRCGGSTASSGRTPAHGS